MQPPMIYDDNYEIRMAEFETDNETTAVRSQLNILRQVINLAEHVYVEMNRFQTLWQELQQGYSE